MSVCLSDRAAFRGYSGFGSNVSLICTRYASVIDIVGSKSLKSAGISATPQLTASDVDTGLQRLQYQLWDVLGAGLSASRDPERRKCKAIKKTVKKTSRGTSGAYFQTRNFLQPKFFFELIVVVVLVDIIPLWSPSLFFWRSLAHRLLFNFCLLT